MTNKLLYNYKITIMYLLYIICALITTNYYAYEIINFNAGLRVFVSSGKTNVRTFDKETGIPKSHSPKTGEYISPFYVVHYGILYSNNIEMNSCKHMNGYHWKRDKSLQYWNVPPETINSNDSKRLLNHSADWLIKNINFKFGKAHFLYNFDWEYPEYPSGKLSAPWWSGLTDGYAIIVLLRAYDCFNDKTYLDAAKSLYDSVLTDATAGGSLTYIDEMPWIEEYVDPTLALKHKLAFVLNGMIYSTHGVKAYETYVAIPQKKHMILEKSIFKNLHRFNIDGWSRYDLLGSNSNPKYHLIHTSLLEEMLKNSPQEYKTHAGQIFQKWKKSAENIGLSYILFGQKTIAWYHFIITVLIIILFPFLLLIKIKKHAH